MKSFIVYQNGLLVYFIYVIVLRCPFLRSVSRLLCYIFGTFSFINKLKHLYGHIFDVSHILILTFVNKPSLRWKILAPVEGESPQ
jgi:hypothetical protein